MARLDAVFTAVKSTSDNCTCDCCHGLSKVIKMVIPYTKYHNGKKLTAQFYNWWICHECYEKLTNAIKEAPNE